MIPNLFPIGLVFCPIVEFLLINYLFSFFFFSLSDGGILDAAAENHGDVVAALADAVSTALGGGAHALHRAAFVNLDLLDIQLSVLHAGTLVLGLPVGNSREDELAHLGSGLSGIVLEDTEGFLDVDTTDEVSDETGFTRRSRIVHQLCHIKGLVGFFTCFCTIMFSTSHFLLKFTFYLYL